MGHRKDIGKYLRKRRNRKDLWGSMRKVREMYEYHGQRILDLFPGYRLTTSWVYYTTNCKTQSSAPEDGQNNCPKYVERFVIINKQLLLHLVGYLYYLYQ